MRLRLVLALGALGFVGCGDPQFVIEVPLAVIAISPQDGAVGIRPDEAPTICFNREMDASIAGSSLVLEQQTAEAEPIAQSVIASSDPHCLLISHETLRADTPFLIRVEQGLAAADGTSFAAEFTSRFRTLP
jgi:hypothetical protein